MLEHENTLSSQMKILFRADKSFICVSTFNVPSSQI